MKKEFYCKIEELSVIAGFTIENATRDIADFTDFSPMFTPDYLKTLGEKRDNVNHLLQSSSITGQLKVATDELVTKMSTLRNPLNKIETYLRLAKDEIDVLPQDTGVRQVRQMIGLGNAEGLMKALRNLTVVLKRNQTALQTKGFTPPMLEEIEKAIAEIDRLNTLQSKLMSARNLNTQHNMTVFNDLWRDLKTILETGKAIYQRVNPAKAKDYTVTELLRRVNAERVKKKEEETKEVKPEN